jgi:hypothetical protein
MRAIGRAEFGLRLDVGKVEDRATRTSIAPNASRTIFGFPSRAASRLSQDGLEVAVAMACLPGAFIRAMPRYKLPLGATAISLLLASCGGGEVEPKPVEVRASD